MIDITESLSYQKMIAEGMAEGKAKGLVEGKAAALRDAILRLGKKKFGKPGAKVVRELSAVNQERRLTELVERILDVESWQELFAHHA